MVKQFEELVKLNNKLVPKSRLKSKGGYRINKPINIYNKDYNKLTILNSQKYNNLSVFVYDDINESKSGYKYLVSGSGVISVTAFITDNGFNRFLRMTGLKKKFIRKTTNGKIYDLIGSYIRHNMAGTYNLLNEFGKKKRLTRTKILSNGEYTTGYYDGKGNIYYLNPNYQRTIYNYFWE